MNTFVMKKTASLSIWFVALMLVACDNKRKIERDDNRYINDHLIDNQWYMTTEKDSILMLTVYRFNDNRLYSQHYRARVDIEVLKNEGNEDMGGYLLSDSLILLPTSYACYIYRLSSNKDTLFLRNPIEQAVMWNSLIKVQPVCGTK